MAERRPLEPLGDVHPSGTVETGTDSDRLAYGGISSRIAPTPEPTRNVVPLFAEPVDFEDDDDASAAPLTDWPNAIQLIRDVGTQIRRERDLAQHLVKQSRSLIQRSMVQAEDAEKRALAAQSDATEAFQRAERAEERARLADERAKQAEERAKLARAGEEEAQLWLRRLYACLRRELGDLTASPR